MPWCGPGRHGSRRNAPRFRSPALPPLAARVRLTATITASPVEYSPPSSSGPGRCPFKAVTGIRIPLGAQSGSRLRSATVKVTSFVTRPGPVVQFGVHAALSRRRPRVQIPSGPLGGLSGSPMAKHDPARTSGQSLGRVAQSVEHTPEKRGVAGSTPAPATSVSVKR